MYYVYIVESESTKTWYYGFTTDLVSRLDGHNKGINKSTASRGSRIYIFIRPFENEHEARRFELYLKKSRNKNFIKRAFAEYFFSM